MSAVQTLPSALCLHDHCSGFGDQAQAGARALLRKSFINIEHDYYTGILSTLLHNLTEADNTF